MARASGRRARLRGLIDSGVIHSTAASLQLITDPHRGVDPALIKFMRTCCLLLFASLTTSCARVEASRQPVEVEMANVDLHVTSDVTLHVKHLRGRFVPVGRDVSYLDDKRSYSVIVDTGEVAIDLASLNALMARSMGGNKSNIKNLHVSIDDGALRQEGVIESGVNMPFKATSNVSATPDGRIRVSTRSVRGFGVPMTNLMKLLHVEMDDLVKVAKGSGVVTDGNDLIIDPAIVIPAPSVRGPLTAVRIEGNQMVQTYGNGKSKPLAARALSPNHIYWKGSQLSFGKLTMSDTDLELVDTDPDDVFDFSVDHWDAQLVAGYSKTLPNRGLQAHMPDYNDLSSSPRR
jgi:hypothetical protein